MAADEEEILDASARGNLTGRELPFGGEFSPGQVELRWLLEAVLASGGSRPALVEAIRAKYFSESSLAYEEKARILQQSKRAGNVVIGLRSYGILDPQETKFSSLGMQLWDAVDLAEMYSIFARHILVELHGLTILQAIETLELRRDRITKTSLARELEQTGFVMPQATTKHIVLLGWLRLAGVLGDKGYGVNPDRVGVLLGSEPAIMSDLNQLSQNERLFLRALGRILTEGNAPVAASEVVRYAENLYSVEFPADQWQARLLRPLEEKGWIILQRGTRGRGAKSGRVTGTPRFENEFVRQLLEEDAPRIPPELVSGLRSPLEQILAELTNSDVNVKGRALELLALRVAQLVDLEFRSYRLRSAETAYAEVDVIVEGTRLLFTRWQIQCKNTKSVRLDDLAKEVGLAVMLKSHVVVMVTTGSFSTGVRSHADVVNATTGFQVVLLDGNFLARLATARQSAATVLMEELNSQARKALLQKSPQVMGIA